MLIVDQCPCFETLRKKFIKKCYYERPNMVKFVDLLKSSDVDTITNVARYLKSAFALRLTLSHNV